jgi:hypothetical protein
MSNIILPSAYREYMRSQIVPPSRTQTSFDLEALGRAMYYLIEVAKPGLVFAPAYPAYLLPDTPEHKQTMDNPTDKFQETITYMITRQEPASTTGAPFSNENRELVKRYRGVSSNDGVNSTLVSGQKLDTLIQFDLWTLSNTEAERLAMWFFRFMMGHRDFLKSLGLSELLFWWRGRDTVSSTIRNALHLRTLVYYVRLEEVGMETIPNLNEVRTRCTLHP